MAVLRPATPADAQAILDLRIANRALIEPVEPDAADENRRYTLDGMRGWVDAPGRYVVLDEGEICGGLGLFDIRGTPLHRAILGYWVDRDHAGRGLATRAVAEAVEIAFGELALHRLEAGTRVDNIGSQRVLQHNRFACVGLQRRHLLIGGEWVDHLLWERLADD